MQLLGFLSWRVSQKPPWYHRRQGAAHRFAPLAPLAPARLECDVRSCRGCTMYIDMYLIYIGVYIYIYIHMYIILIYVYKIHINLIDKYILYR